MKDTEFATQEELESAGETPIPLDILDTHLHSFFVAYTKTVKTVGMPVVLNPGGGYVLGGAGELAGYNISASADAVVKLHDGPDNSFPVVLTATIPANGTEHGWFLPGGIHYDRGISLEVTGAITGNIYVVQEIAL